MIAFLFKSNSRAQTRYNLLILCCLLSIIGSCRTAPQTGSNLHAIDEPSALTEIDAIAQQQYRERRARLDECLATPTTDTKQTADAYGRLGMWFHAYLYPRSAEKCYLNALSLDGYEPRWPYYLGLANEELGRFDAAKTAFKSTLSLQPGYLPASVRLADLERKTGDLETAGIGYRKALRVDPNCTPALYGLALVRLEQNQPGEATQLLEKALILQPGIHELHYSLGLAYRQLGNLEQAQRHLAQVQVTNKLKKQTTMADPLLRELNAIPASGKIFSTRGVRALLEGNYAKAIEDLSKAVDMLDDQPAVHLQLGKAYFMAGDYRQAAQRFEKILTRWPDQASAHFHLGICYQIFADTTRAEAHYRKALEIDNQNLSARLLLGNLKRDAGHFDEALALYEANISATPDHRAAYHSKIVALLLAGRYEQADTSVTSTMNLFPDDRVTRMLAARLRAAAPDSTVRDGAAALALAGPLADRPTLSILETLAMAHAETANFAEATALQRKALELTTDDQTVARKRIEARLQRYLQKQPCRRPWEPGESIQSRDTPLPANAASSLQ